MHQKWLFWHLKERSEDLIKLISVIANPQKIPNIMALMSFFKKTPHQKFKYNPQHYDPRKEDLEKRLRLAEKARNGDPNAMGQRISSGFRQKHAAKKGSYGNSAFRTNMLLLAIIAVLVTLTYLLLTVYLPRIVQMVE